MGHGFLCWGVAIYVTIQIHYILKNLHLYSEAITSISEKVSI